MLTNSDNRRWFKIVAVIICSLSFTAVTRAGWDQQDKMTASDGAAYDEFGCSVSVSGDYAIFGADRDDDNGENSGSAYIFKRQGTNWTQQAKLTASDGTFYDEFGHSVSISGDYCLVGAYHNDAMGGDSGSAYIFKRDGTNWTQQAKLTASDGAAIDFFGWSVSLSGDYAIAGALNDGDKGEYSGSAYIFKRDGANWAQQAKLLALDGLAGDSFGTSVSISGDYAIVGATGDDVKGDNSGSAYIFKRDGTYWVQQDKLIPSDPAPGDLFGTSVSISGDYCVVGAYHDDDKGDMSGSAYVFKREGTNWILQDKLTASDGAAGDAFGFSASISGDYALVGASYNDYHGSAYMFKRQGSNWIQQYKLTASDGAVADSFGWSVSISGDYCLAGAHDDDDKGLESGSAYVFARDRLTCGAAVVNPGTRQDILALGYNNGTLEFRDWQGNLLQNRSGLGEITAIEAYRCSDSPLPRLFVASTDSGGALRIIDPANINSDLASRFGFGRITVLSAWPNALYVGSTDLGGTLRRLDSTTLADQTFRFGFGEVTALCDVWTTSNTWLAVGSTDSTGTLRMLDPDTLWDDGPVRFGFTQIDAMASGDMDGDGNAELVMGSADTGGTLRIVEAPTLSTDKGTRYGFGTVYDVAYGALGIGQSLGDPSASILVGSADGAGAIRVIVVDPAAPTVSLDDSAARFGFDQIASTELDDMYRIGVDLAGAVTTDGGTVAGHIMDENLTDLSFFLIP